mgnify:CR=1 FL=1
MGMLNSCVIGNFGLTRKVANWNLSFSLIPRVIVAVILQVLPVYQVAFIFDMVLNNTVEFWTKSRLIGALLPQKFKNEAYAVTVKHAYQPLKYTRINIKDLETLKTDTIEVVEKTDSSIHILKNGKQVANIDQATNLLVVSHYNKEGEVEKRDSYDLSDKKIIAKLEKIFPLAANKLEKKTKFL